MGTNLGYLIRVNLKENTWKKLNKQTHTKKINYMYLEQGTAVFTASDDGMLIMTPFSSIAAMEVAYIDL